jgi:hypothetical protein
LDEDFGVARNYEKSNVDFSNGTTNRLARTSARIPEMAQVNLNELKVTERKTRTLPLLHVSDVEKKAIGATVCVSAINFVYAIGW